MQMRLLVVPSLVFALLASGPARTRSAEDDAGQRPKKNEAQVARGESFVSVVTQHTGEPILAVIHKRRVMALIHSHSETACIL